MNEKTLAKALRVLDVQRENIKTAAANGTEETQRAYYSGMLFMLDLVISEYWTNGNGVSYESFQHKTIKNNK